MAIGQAVGVGHDRLTTHLAKRVARIQSLIPRIAGLPIQAGDGKGRHKAWMMLTKVAMRALDYDAKLIPSPVMERMTSDMQQMLEEATDVILGCNLDADQQRLVQQPGCFGGLGARRLSRGTRAVAALLGHVGSACAGAADAGCRAGSAFGVRGGRGHGATSEAEIGTGRCLCEAERHSQVLW